MCWLGENIDFSTFLPDAIFILGWKSYSVYRKQMVKHTISRIRTI